MLLLTIGIVSALFIISFLIFDKDLLAPPTVVALVFLFGCFCVGDDMDLQLVFLSGEVQGLVILVGDILQDILDGAV